MLYFRWDFFGGARKGSEEGEEKKERVKKVEAQATHSRCSLEVLSKKCLM